MSTTTERIRVASDLALHPADGPALPVSDVELALDRDAHGVVVQVLTSVTLQPEAWARVDRDALFHLDPEARGPVFGGTLADDAPVTLDLSLDPAHREDLLDGTGDIYEVGARLRDADAPWARPEAWWALRAHQPRGDVRTGFATRWA